MSEHPPVPNLNLEREQAAFRELGETRVSVPVARSVLWLFVLTLAAVPLFELARQPAGQPGVAGAFRELVTGPLDACAIQGAEDRIEERSQAGDGLRPVVQAALTRVFGLGNEQVYVGEGGWLFQRAGVDHVTGPGFLEAHVLARRVRDADPCERPPAPDPWVAIERFHEDLARRGIELVLVPTPVKGVLEGARFGGEPGALLRNRSFERFTATVEAGGVAVYDPAPRLARWRDDARHAAYLATDTHWRPEAMEAVAEDLARFLEQRFELGERSLRSERRPVLARNRGDLAALLGLEAWASPFPLEDVTVQEVRDEEGRLWKPTRNAPVLLLGDSFSNIYAVRRAFAQSEDGVPLDWGEAAGLAEQLSHHLERPVDRIARNAGGAHATRRDLVRELAAGRDRLLGVRVVVWQFAVRELSQGDWRALPLPLPVSLEGRP